MVKVIGEQCDCLYTICLFGAEPGGESVDERLRAAHVSLFP